MVNVTESCENYPKSLFISIKKWLRFLPPINNAARVTSKALKKLKILIFFSIFAICNVKKNMASVTESCENYPKSLFSFIKNWLCFLPPLNNAAWVTNKALMKLKILNFFLFFLFAMLWKTWPMLLKDAKISQKVCSSPSKIDSVFCQH